MSHKARGFTFMELLISAVIVGIVGSAAIAALWFAFASYAQMDDYSAMDGEIEYAFQRLSRDLALAGLGMPNNRKAMRSFASTFQVSGGASPIMALFQSELDGNWGGPITVAKANPSNQYNAAAIRGDGLWKTSAGLGGGADLGPGDGAYVGPELYYVHAIPTGVKGRFRHSGNASTLTAGNNTSLEIFELYSPNPSVSGGNYLADFQYEGRDAGLPRAAPSGLSGRNMRAWLLFPTLRLPMLLTRWEANRLEAMAAPGDSLTVSSAIMGLDEIHLIQAARLYRNANDELVRVLFGSDYTAPGGRSEEVLARGIVGLQFVYNPQARLLTMYIAARGSEANPPRQGAGGWPKWLPDRIAPENLSRRVLVKSLTWRIRN